MIQEAFDEYEKEKKKKGMRIQKLRIRERERERVQNIYLHYLKRIVIQIFNIKYKIYCHYILIMVLFLF